MANEKQLLMLRERDATAWNAWRTTHRHLRIELNGVDLSQADLSGMDLSQADLTGADLSGAHLSKANLRESDLTQADLSGAVLRFADLSGADLTHAVLRDVDLTHASVLHVVGLRAGQLGGADVTAASLPSEIQSFEPALAQATTASKNARNLFIGLIVACVYSLITICTTTDRLLILNSSSSGLPVIQVPVPVAGFYVVAPLLLVCLYVYLHLCLQRLWEALAGLPATLCDGSQLYDRVFPWLLSGLVLHYFPRLREHGRRFVGLQFAVAFFLTWFAVPLLFVVFWMRYLCRHDWAGTSLHVVLLSSLLVLAPLFFVTTCRTLSGICSRSRIDRSRKSQWRLPIWGWLCLCVMAPFIIISLAAALDTCDGYVARFLVACGRPPYACLTDEELSTKPPTWSEDDTRQPGVVGAELRGVDLRCAQMQGVFLVKANLRNANMSHANLKAADVRLADLSDADLKWANLWEVKVQGAKFNDADLAHARITKANFSGATLRAANLAKVRSVIIERLRIKGGPLGDLIIDRPEMFGGTLFRGKVVPQSITGAIFFQADLVSANLEEADLTEADLREARLTLANMCKANLDRADLSAAALGRADLSGASFVQATLRNVDLHEADLRETNLSRADLRGTHLCSAELAGACLSGSIVDEATDFTHVHVDPNTDFTGVNLTDSHRRQIWGPDG